MPIDANSVEKILLEKGFVSDHETDKKKRFISKEINQYVYINKTSGDKDSTLVIHPDFKDNRQDFLLLKGVDSSEPIYHSSNMGEFPKRINNGKTPISYGIPFGFQDTSACVSFLNKFTGKGSIEYTDEIDDIDSANESLSLLTETERKAIVKSRIGQGVFRELLIQYWKGCSITGLNYFPVLKASHIKPWKVSSNYERLDPFNGLFLTPNLDTAFDRGYISFSDNGEIIISSKLSLDAQKNLGIDSMLKLRMLADEHKKYLSFHRDNVLKY